MYGNAGFGKDAVDIGGGSGVFLVGQVFEEHVAVGMGVVPQLERGDEVEFAVAGYFLVDVEHQARGQLDVLAMPDDWRWGS